VFDYSKTLRSRTATHTAVISSLSLISENDSTYTIASSSHDRTGQITQITLPDNGSSSSTVLATLHLHTAPLSSINSHNKWLLTSSWDGLVGFWDTSIPQSDEIPDPTLTDRGKKRRRMDEGPKPKRKAPLSVFKSHTSRVSKAIFSPSRQNKAYSCGFDSTVRIWDTEYGICEYTFVSHQLFFWACLHLTLNFQVCL
jgi:ribosome biogenesis protein YTM1